MQRTLLVLDDDPQFLQEAESRLKEAGYQVLLACKLAQALELSDTLSSELDAAMIDLVLGNESGLDALREIRAILPHLPIIVFSGYASDTDFAVAAKLGAAATIRKPVADDWFSAIHRLIS